MLTAYLVVSLLIGIATVAGGRSEGASLPVSCGAGLLLALLWPIAVPITMAMIGYAIVRGLWRA